MFPVRPLSGVLCAAAAFTTAVDAAHARQDHPRPQPRVVVADGARGYVRVLDARHGARIERFRVAGPAGTLATAGDGRHVILTQTDADRVDVLDAGAWTVDHGDHVHNHTAKPRKLPFALRTDTPIHTVPHGDHLAIFADGEGAAHLFGLGDLRRPARPEHTLTTTAPHHGAAVPVGDRTVITNVTPEDPDAELPPLLEVRDEAGAVLATYDCPEAHGETSGARWVAFACADGIVVVRPGAPSATAIGYPGGHGDDRSYTLRTDASGRHAVGSFGKSGFVVADIAAGTMRHLRSPGTVVDFHVDSASRRLIVLTDDGRLRRVDLRTGEQTSRRVIPRRFEAVFGKPSPGLAVRGGFVAVSDPRRNRVTVLRTAKHLPVLSRTAVPGAPSRVALAGPLR